MELSLRSLPSTLTLTLSFLSHLQLGTPGLQGKMLEILKGIHESTFKDHKVIIEE